LEGSLGTIFDKGFSRSLEVYSDCVIISSHILTQFVQQ
jgi:hypothetical protein